MCVFLRVYVCWVDFWRKEGCVLYECYERWYAALRIFVMYMWCEFRGFWLSGLARVWKSVCRLSPKASQGLIIFDPRNAFLQGSLVQGDNVYVCIANSNG